ncbi:hypothetical protein niasHT_029984 [Heterodera trifolii]|uniref:Uncharacterized protein n=1 Tax=Heterodera trifolii TaxID=157864 RepID=A0ABD2JJI0_9BILA
MNAFLPLFVVIILSVLVEHLQSDNSPNPFTRQFFTPNNQRAQQMRPHLNVQNGQQPFRTITMNGGQQFVLVPRRLFFQKGHLFAFRRHLPSLAKFKIRPNFASHEAKQKQALTSNLKQMPMPKEVPNSTRLAMAKPKQHALPIAVSPPTNAKSAEHSSHANSLIASDNGRKSGFVPRLTNAGTESSAAPFSPRPFAIPQKASFLRSPPKIHPPMREVSSNVRGNGAEMTRKRDDFFKKQRKEFQMMRERIERRRMEMERQQSILEEEERLNMMARTRTMPTAPQFGGMRRPQHFQAVSPISGTSRPNVATPVASPPAAVAPPGQMPPNDQVIDQLNNAIDFMDVANRLRLRDQFRRRQKVHANV